MRSVADHVSAVLAAAQPMAPLDVVLADADGCVLAEEVAALQDFPRRAVADRDGYAVRAADVVGGPARLPVVADARPASAVIHLVAGSAVLVAAGAPVPRGADAVVALEDTDRGRANVAIRGSVRPGDGVRPAGRDAAAGQVVLTAGLRLGPRHLAYAAAIGRSRLWVRPAPRVVVVTVGDELVDAGRRLRDGTVHDADAHALVAAAREAGANAVRVGPVTDDRAVLREVLADQLVRADLLVLAGGLSAGPWDTVADVLGPLGTVRLDGVSMSPGGRQGLGTVRGMTLGETDDVAEDDRPGALVVALPGHPVAALLSFEMFVRPAVRKMAGYTELFRPSVRATAARRWGSPAGMTQLVPGTVVGSPAHGYEVTPLGDPDQVSLAALARANVLAVIPEDTIAVLAGDSVACLVLES